MESSRRAFLGQLGRSTGAVVATGLFSQAVCRRVEALVADHIDVPPDVLASDETFWRPIQQAFTVDRSLIHLNAGGVSPSPRTVQGALKRYLDHSNNAPSFTMWRQLEPNKENVRVRLARLAGTSPEEVAIVRNATEALENVIFGLDFEPGDEILTSTQDYPSMLVSWEQRVKRNGVVLKKVPLPTPPGSSTELVEAFRKGFTDRTRLVMVSHMVNLTGQIMPVREICRLAHARGVEVLVDGAHTFAHLQFRIPDLECDYFGTSLHKWLCAPFGTGLLWVKRDKIARVWPLFGHEEPRGSDIRKFERIGTHPVANFLAIGEAVHFHTTLGGERKQERLRFLKDYWVQGVRELPGARINTVLDPAHSCGLGNFTIEGREPVELVQRLLAEHRVVVTPITHEECEGIRVTPHLYTTRDELDMFLEAVARLTKS